MCVELTGGPPVRWFVIYTPRYLNNRTNESMLWDALTLGSVLLT